MSDEKTPTTEHGMLPGSQESMTGPKCRCGAEWDWWGDRCAREEDDSFRDEPHLFWMTIVFGFVGVIVVVMLMAAAGGYLGGSL